MELSGHPTQDLVEELVERGAVVVETGPDGPDPDSVAGLVPGAGHWLWLPEQAFDTGVDEHPPRGS